MFDKIKNIFTYKKCMYIFVHSMVCIRPDSPAKFKREKARQLGVDKAMTK